MTLLKRNQLNAKARKCQFMAQYLVFIGHVVSKDGFKPEPDKFKAVSETPLPQDHGQLCAFLGMIAYVRRFIPYCGDSQLPYPQSPLKTPIFLYSWEGLLFLWNETVTLFRAHPPVLSPQFSVLTRNQRFRSRHRRGPLISHQVWQFITRGLQIPRTKAHQITIRHPQKEVICNCTLRQEMTMLYGRCQEDPGLNQT